MSDHDRSDSIRLPVEEARCEPSGACVVRGRCARYQAFMPLKNASIEDYSIGPSGGSLLCRGFLSSGAFIRVAPTARPPRHFGPLE